jgi:hypothetical protein
MTGITAAMRCYFAFELTPWSRILLEKLIVIQLTKKFTAINGTRRLTAVFKSDNTGPPPVALEIKKRRNLTHSMLHVGPSDI